MPIEIKENSPERLAHLKETQGFIVLVKVPGQNDYTGLIENSFSLGTSKDCTQFFWSGTATSNFGTKHVLDGRADAQERIDYYKRLRPDWQMEIFDARDDENLPVIINWEKWYRDNRPANNLSGVANKYGARNLSFKMKEDNHDGDNSRNAGKVAHV